MAMRGLEYTRNGTELGIQPYLNGRAGFKLMETLLKFCKENGASYFEAEFFGKIHIESTAYSRILQKAKEVSFNEEPEQQETDKLYNLRAKFNEKFLKQFMVNYFLTIEVDIFNKKNEKIANFSKNGIDSMYISDEKVKELKKRLKPFEENTDKWKEIIIRLNEESAEKPIPTEVYHKHLISNNNIGLWVDLLSSDVIWGKQIRKLIKDFDFSHFDKMLASLTNPKARYKKIWKAEDLLRIFNELEEKIRENDGKLPKYYWIWTYGRVGGKMGWSRWHDIYLEANSTKWRFMSGLGKAQAKPSTGKKINLIKDDSIFKIGKAYDGGGIIKQYWGEDTNVRKFKITANSFYEQHREILSKIKETCEYAREQGYKISMTVGVHY